MKKIVTILAALFITVASLSAADFHITVIDSEIEIPLEGVTLTLSNNKSQNWETDFNGECILTIEDFSSAVILQAYLPGYAIKKTRLKENETEITIILSIEEIMEGRELVVEKEAYQRGDAESGISVALTKDQIQTTSLIGVIPDVMSTVKTLPGVAYAGAFCQQPSIRGSYPYETSCVLDGMYVLQPYHWSGTISIFDPLMVESVKLSHGIFSAQYGHATAALLDVNSVNPVGDSIKVNSSISSIQSDLYAQIPITNTFGAVAGFRMSYMNTLPWLYDNLGITERLTRGTIKKLSDFLRMPYMYDYYLKMFYTPSDRITVGLNGFLGMEGLGARFLTDTPADQIDNPVGEDENGYDTYHYYNHIFTHADWDNVFGFAAANIKLLPVDNLQLVFDGSFNLYNSKVDILLDGGTEYNYSTWKYYYPENTDKLHYAFQDELSKIEYIDSYKIELFQGKTAANFQLDEINLFSLGFEELYQRKSYFHGEHIDFHYTSADWWEFEPKPETPAVSDIKHDLEKELKGNDIYNTVGYTFWEFGNDATLLSGELGLRYEDYYIKRKDDKASLHTNPYFNPRFTIKYVPIRYGNYIDKLTFSAGSGIFTKMIDEVIDLGPEYKINKDNVKADRNVFGLVGTEIEFLENVSFQAEIYYKEYLDRLYKVATPTNVMDELGNFKKEYAVYSDGKGRVAGMDCMLHKKSGRHLDGYLCYSFVYARFKNPTGYKKDVVDRTESRDPLGIWYWPYYHRFNTLNAVINYRPVSGITWTVSGGITSGNPKQFTNEILGTTVYSDKKRNPPIYPMNVRLAFSNYAMTTKLKWEVYIGGENLLGMFNQSSLLGSLIANRDIDISNIANFDTGIPSISAGFRLSY